MTADGSTIPVIHPLPLHAVQSPRLHEGVVQQLVQQIVGGTFAPGDSLPTEPHLAQRFGVSRTVVREAVRVLASKGLVSVRQGSGMRVQPRDQWDHLDPLVIVEQVRSSGDDSLLDELIETRRVLETEIAAFAAVRRTDEHLAHMRAALDVMRAALPLDDVETYTRGDVLFHEALLDAAGNRLLRVALRPVSSVLHAGQTVASRRAGVLERSLPSHEAIFDAVLAGDASGAREGTRRHIANFEEDVRAGVRAGAHA